MVTITKYARDGRIVDYTYVDLNGKPVERTPSSHPYNYDMYVLGNWGHQSTDSSMYSDRFQLCDSDKEGKLSFHALKRKHMPQNGDYFTCVPKATIELILSEWYDKPIELTALLQGCNVSSGYPLWLFYFRDKKSEV